MNESEPNGPPKIWRLAQGGFRLSLIAGGVSLFFWLLVEPERWSMAMLWFSVGTGLLGVWYGTPRVIHATRCMWQEAMLLKWVAGIGAFSGLFSGPVVAGYLAGGVSGTLALIAVASFWGGFFFLSAMMIGEDAC